MNEKADHQLLAFNPLETIVLPGNQCITPKGLILIVGPNSSGKTQLLKDIQQSILGQIRTLVVATEIKITKPKNFDTFVETLEREGYIRKEIGPRGSHVIKTKTSALGGFGSIPQETEYETAKGWFNSFSEGQRNTHSQQFYSVFGSMLSTSLFLMNRLTAANRSNNFDYETSPPTTDLQALYFSSSAQEELTNEVKEAFGRGIWVDPTRGNILCFRVTDSPNLPSGEARLCPDKVTTVGRVMDDEGDGLRSFVAVSMCLALSRRPVCLIDEPEICLHPPQAYALGRSIGRQVTRHSSTTFVATHSSHVLRGVIQEAKDLQIIRLTRSNGRFHSHLVDSQVLRNAIEKPLVRSEAIFDGIFADGVVLVESDGDRAVYQAVWETLSSPPQLDLLFVPVNGKGAMADIAAFFSALHIPVAVIVDLDLVKDDGSIPKLLSALEVEPGVAGVLKDECLSVAEKIKAVPPTITPVDAKARIKECSEQSMDWSKNDDETIMRQLRRLANEVDRMRKLEKGGIQGFEKNGLIEIAKNLESLKQKFWNYGVFIVPVGTLESWLSEDFMKNAPSKERKQEYADEAAKRIKMRPSEAGQITDFIQSVALFLTKKA